MSPELRVTSARPVSISKTGKLKRVKRKPNSLGTLSTVADFVYPGGSKKLAKDATTDPYARKKKRKANPSAKYPTLCSDCASRLSGKLFGGPDKNHCQSCGKTDYSTNLATYKVSGKTKLKANHKAKNRPKKKKAAKKRSSAKNRKPAVKRRSNPAKIYKRKYAGYTLQIMADFSQASSPIRYRTSNSDSWDSTPFQVASFRHNSSAALAGVHEWLGSQYG